MLQPAPQTTAALLLEKINELGAARLLLDTTDPIYFELLRGAAQLAKADPSAAEVVRGALYALTGNAEATIAAFGRAASGDANNVRINESQAMLNLGMYTRAQDLFRAFGSPTSGRFADWETVGLTSGAFTTLANRYVTAIDKMLLEPVEDRSFVQSCAQILERSGVDERQLAEMMNFTGEVMLSRKMSCRLGEQQFNIFADEGLIAVYYALPCSYAEASDMTMELVELLALNLESIPTSIAVSFRGMH